MLCFVKTDTHSLRKMWLQSKILHQARFEFLTFFLLLYLFYNLFILKSTRQISLYAANFSYWGAVDYSFCLSQAILLQEWKRLECIFTCNWFPNKLQHWIVSVFLRFSSISIPTDTQKIYNVSCITPFFESTCLWIILLHLQSELAQQNGNTRPRGLTLHQSAQHVAANGV